MTLYHLHPFGSLYCGDALTVLRDLPDQTVNLCVTSPPYYDHKTPNRHPDVLGLEPHSDAYIQKLEQIFSEIWRLMKSDGIMWLVLDAFGVDALLLGNVSKWFLYQTILCQDGIIQVFAVRYRRDLPRLKTQDYRSAKLGIPIAEPQTGKVVVYPAFSRDIPRQAIKWCCPPNGVVLDPFMGQGTTILEAVRKGKQFIGVDISPEMFDAVSSIIRGYETHFTTSLSDSTSRR